jgi:5-methylcytosine-specific restriction enzyme subunit McrC
MIERERITLFEYGSEVRDLSQLDIRELMAAGGRALTLAPTGTAGQFQLKANSLIGTIVTSRLEVIINPKIPIENVFLLLEPSKTPIDLRTELVGFGDYLDITPAFAAFFARLLEHTLARGMRRDYIPVQDDLVAVRGRVALDDVVRRPVLTPLACRFDEYSIDTPHHRILKAATLRLCRVPGIGVRNRDALRHLLMRFGEVDDQPPATAQVLRRGFNRLERHYEPAVRLACLLLDEGSLLHSFGTTTAGAFLFDMNRAFEAFLEARLEAALRGTLEVRGQAQTYLDSDERVRMKPDLIFGRNGSAVYVGDAKYKVSKDINGVDSDLYQLLAYTTALDLPEGVLVYAQADQAIPPQVINVALAGKRLHIQRIDLSGDARAIRRSVDALAAWIVERVAATSNAHAPT